MIRAHEGWSRPLITIGSIATLAGAIDPMEGSLLILLGSGLVALGTFLGHAERRLIAYRMRVFILIAIGVAALWGLSMVGGIGGSSGHSVWWGVLILPYPVGWLMGLWGPRTPHWVPWLGIGVGLWYLTISGLILWGSRAGGAMSAAPSIVIGVIGVLTIGGCVYRLRRTPASAA